MTTPADGTGVGGRPSGSRAALTGAGLLLGMGFGGFVDGIVIHQILQWHHMGTAHGEHASFPDTTVASLEQNTLWDGLFHAGTWVLAIAGLFLLWRALAGGRRATWRTLTGLLLAGWGLFNLVEGVVNHQLLGIHHVRDDLGGPLSWDLGFLGFGLALVLGGALLARSDRRGRGSGAGGSGPGGSGAGRVSGRGVDRVGTVSTPARSTRSSG